MREFAGGQLKVFVVYPAKTAGTADCCLGNCKGAELNRLCFKFRLSRRCCKVPIKNLFLCMIEMTGPGRIASEPVKRGPALAGPTGKNLILSFGRYEVPREGVGAKSERWGRVDGDRAGTFGFFLQFDGPCGFVGWENLVFLSFAPRMGMFLKLKTESCRKRRPVSGIMFKKAGARVVFFPGGASSPGNGAWQLVLLGVRGIVPGADGCFCGSVGRQPEFGTKPDWDRPFSRFAGSGGGA